MIIQVYDDDLLNGEGIREVVFLQGCHHHCKGCFSPETWAFKAHTEESIRKDIAYTEHITNKLQEDYISGLTISGGDPFASENLEQTKCLIDITKTCNKTVWIYTGYTFEDLYTHYPDFIEQIDVLCDGEFKEELKSPDKPWVGSENQRVIDVQKSLKENKVILYA